ncbi:MAG: hypothetical protein NDI95_01920 [Acidovorax soli]|uniref:hypothetical protein n=1 Tax=Acidovorax soli TaxID=592050 RepID=UPI0026EBC37B|nr:hypothetical protein [Acidovorax soli]MCM2345397.1 hypothetical protein [Acidovorax soli]
MSATKNHSPGVNARALQICAPNPGYAKVPRASVMGRPLRGHPLDSETQAMAYPLGLQLSFSRVQRWLLGGIYSNFTACDSNQARHRPAATCLPPQFMPTKSRGRPAHHAHRRSWRHGDSDFYCCVAKVARTEGCSVANFYPQPHTKRPNNPQAVRFLVLDALF